MRRPSKDSSNKLSAESQRLSSISQAIVQSASRVEERTWERQLDAQLQKLLKTNHQESIDAALNALFKDDLAAYDVLMDGVEAVSESSTMVEQANDGAEVTWQALLVAAPILAWTRFSIGSGTIPAELLTTLSAHFSAHLLAEGTQMAMAPTLYAIDQLPRTHAETYGLTHKLAQAAHKGTSVKPAVRTPETAPFLADTRYLLVALVAPVGAPLFRWQEPQHQIDFEKERTNALEAWREQATANVARLLPGCGVELLLPEAYYVACREADKAIRPVSIRAAVHYLTNTLDVEASDLRAVVAGFGEEAADGQIDEYRVGFTLRQSAEVVYGIVWPLYGQEDEEGTPMEGPAGGLLPAPLSPIDEITAHLNEAGVTHIKRINELYVAEYCDDCGSPLFADPTGELVHAEMPEDTPAGSEHFH
ncbi:MULTISPECIES: DUF2863 family protein [unclassified Massilia]|uniref:DUF2863 family protein n=1 Tax=unclassified Massilia TaxID=2609279 RepID=UPI001780039A|nr:MULTISPECIES: DUF2863 family protein [unclassified Massilia]MBD8530253.1 DUF2863 family protein [Massilia sp. CFBP 13647]MBD8673030.1 DUF2863 family protein [Massilia sp. CFBP 13721]